MNTEKLKAISNLIDEGIAFKSHIEKMEAECKSIQQYCLDALQDFHDTFCAVGELIEKNPQIAKWEKDGKAAWLGNSYGDSKCCFKYHTATSQCGAWVEYIGYQVNNNMKGLMCWGNAGHSPIMTAAAILKVKQNIAARTTEGKMLGIWINAKEWAEETRQMSEALLEAMRYSAETYKKAMREIMDKGVSASAEKYAKVAQ